MPRGKQRLDSPTCRRGHPWADGDYYWTPNGYKVCKRCRRVDRQPKGEPGGTHIPRAACKRGHAMAGDNIGWCTRRGKRTRFCRACKYMSPSQRRHSLKVAKNGPSIAKQTVEPEPWRADYERERIAAAERREVRKIEIREKVRRAVERDEQYREMSGLSTRRREAA